jgi:RHS repeat-associated protein
MDYAFTTSPEDLILSRTENDGSAVARHDRRHHGWEIGRHEGWDHAPHWGVLAWLLGERDDDRHADRRSHRQADPGQRGHHRDHDAEDGTSGVATQYIYDPDRRLLAATGGITRDYAYDPADNLTAIATPDATTTIGTNSVNAITIAGSRSYHYDANGNVLDDGQRTYAWDAENRLIRITDTASGHVSAFAYDGRSHRLAVTETGPGATPVETRYLWCGETVCEARDGAEAVIARYYGQGELKNGQAYYYAQDQVGSVVALVDAAGHVAGRVGYDPYGNVISSTGTLPDYRYAGLYGHDPSGLFLATYRAYDPAVGRWLNRDPIGLAGG